MFCIYLVNFVDFIEQNVYCINLVDKEINAKAVII